MAQQNQTHGRSIELKTLVIAALAALTAAIVTSFFWKRGTLISTALTPVIVTLTQELLRRPAEKISTTASRVTPSPVRGVSALAAVGGRRPSETGRFSEQRLLERERGEYDRSGGSVGHDAGPENGRRLGDVRTNGADSNGANGGGFPAPPPPLDDTRSYDPARSAGADLGPGDTAPAAAAGQTGERRVYGRGGSRWRIALLTAVAAFAIAAVVLTVSELALGGSIGGDGRTSLFGGDPGSERSGGGDGEGSGGSSDDSSDEGDDASPSGSSESQSVPEEDGESVPAPEEEPVPEEPAEPVEPEPVEPAPSEPAPQG